LIVKLIFHHLSQNFMATIVTGYSSSKIFQVGTSTRFIIAYLYADISQTTIKDHDGFDIAMNNIGDEVLDQTIAALVAANAWVQAQLNPIATPPPIIP
jgi:hypothetical protein